MRITTSLCSLILANIVLGQSLTDSLVAHFPLDGNGMDTVGGLIPILVLGTPVDTTDRFGVPGKALWFDGSSCFSYGDVLDMDTSDFSIAVWFRSEDPTPGNANSDHIFNKGCTVYGTPGYAGYCLSIEVDGANNPVASGDIGDQASVYHGAEVPMTLDTWHHAVLLKCDTSLRIALDGLLVDSTSVPPGSNVNTNIHFAIGALVRDPTPQPDQGYFQGILDDLRVYKGRCLTEQELLLLASNGPVGLSDGIQGGELLLWPNPALSSFQLRVDEPATILVRDASGRVVHQTRVAQGATILHPGLAPGSYSVEAVSLVARRTTRLIIAP